MKDTITSLLTQLTHTVGSRILKYCPQKLLSKYPSDFDKTTIETIQTVKPYTMTSPERVFALCESIKYIVKHKVKGDIVECGVWKGGSMMAVARTLLSLGDSSRNLYLFDTFKGMTTPGRDDTSFNGVHASEFFRDGSLCCSPLEEVKEALNTIGYPNEKIRFVEGRVEDTVPFYAPQTISLLRLDTDWYESTLHEMTYLFPRLSTGGVIIIDDYGHWKGSRKAVDEYLERNKVKILLNRIDYTGRIGVVAN